jgi:hypothetical protein
VQEAAEKVILHSASIPIGKHPSAAKAAMILRDLAARLEAAPFQKRLCVNFFRSLLRRR